MTKTFEIRGLERLERKYAKLGKDLGPELKQLSDRAAVYAHSKVPPYPPPPPNSRYTRTGTLGRRITTKARKLGPTRYVGVIGTDVKYAPWVISTSKGKNSAGPQAWMHKNRWWTLQGVIKDNREGIVEIYRQGIRRLLRRV